MCLLPRPQRIVCLLTVGATSHVLTVLITLLVLVNRAASHKLVTQIVLHVLVLHVAVGPSEVADGPRGPLLKNFVKVSIRWSLRDQWAT